MKKLLLLLVAIIALVSRAQATDIDIGASSIVGFNSANAGSDTPLTGVTVTLGSPSVTCSNCLPVGAVGLSGMKVALGSLAVTYDIASVASRSAFTLTTNYAASTGTVSGTLYKFVHLRIYVTSPFVPAGSTTVVQSGSVGSTAWYRRYGVSIINDGAQNVAYIPAVNDLPATTDSSNPTATYVAGLWTQGGGFMQSYPGCVDEWRLTHLTTPTSWAQICSFNLPPNPPPNQPLNYLTEAQIDARFPSCSAGQMLYYLATGNVQNCLSLAPGDFSISGGVLSSLNVTKQLQEEGGDLPIRNKINFVGSAYTAADDAGNNRTNVTADADLSAIASLSGTGYAQRTGVDTWALNANVVTGPASATDNAIARFDLTTGKIIQNSAVTVADTTGNFAVPNAWQVSNADGVSYQQNSLAGSTHLFSVPTRSAAGDNFEFRATSLTQSSSVIRGISYFPTYNQSGTASSNDIAIVRTETALGSGQHNFLVGFGGAAGATSRFRINNLGNYFFGASGGFIGDENGNKYLSFVTTGSAVNNLEIGNAPAGSAPFFRTVGTDTNIPLEIAPKGTGRALFTGSGGIEITNAVPNFRITDTSSSKTFIQTVDGSGNLVIGEEGISNAIAIAHTTGTATFEEIPVGPAADPTTANQLTRKDYVDNKNVSFSASFTIVDPSTVTLSDLQFGTIIIPAGGQYTITKCKVARVGGTHTGGGSVTFIVQQQGVGTKCTLNLNDTNNTVNTVYTDDVGDFTVSENAILGALVSARSGTVSERNVTVTIEGFRKVF